MTAEKKAAPTKWRDDHEFVDFLLSKEYAFFRCARVCSDCGEKYVGREQCPACKECAGAPTAKDIKPGIVELNISLGLVLYMFESWEGALDAWALTWAKMAHAEGVTW